jgi:hypothetical protein
MNQANRPKRWQLDAFVLLMIILMLLVMQAHLSSSWETVADIAWCALTLSGMGLWVYVNWAALQQEEQRRRRRRCTPDQDGASESRTIPLTPAQRRFLIVTQAHSHTEDPE